MNITICCIESLHKIHVAISFAKLHLLLVLVMFYQLSSLYYNLSCLSNVIIVSFSSSVSLVQCLLSSSSLFVLFLE